MSTEARFFGRVVERDDCWVWTGGTRRGYGAFWLDGRNVAAHRWAYEFLRGAIPAGLQLDHLCRVLACVNPWHLEPVTGRVNTLRGLTITAASAARTRCPAGHVYAGDNLRITPTGRRVCRTCHRRNAAACRKRKAAA